MSSAIHEKKRIPILKKSQKNGQKYDFWEQNNAPKAKNHVFKQKIPKTMNKMMSWGMSAPFLKMPVTLRGIKKHLGRQNILFWAFGGPDGPGGPGGRLFLFLSLLSLARP